MLHGRPQHYRALGLARGVNPTLINRALLTAARVAQVDRRLPAILTLRHLAHLTGTSYAVLRSAVSRHLPGAYTTFRIQKAAAPGGKPGTSGFRIIAVPSASLMTVQQWVSRNILSYGRPNAASTAYAPGCSVVRAAEPHCGCRWLLKLDVRRFFESISEVAVYRVFLNEFGYQPLVAFELARLCTRLPENFRITSSSRWYAKVGRYSTIKHYRVAHLGHLPQGAPSSPMLANLAVKDFDTEMARIAVREGLVYTRYADDLTFSTSDRDFSRIKASEIVRKAYAVMGKAGLSPNTSKTNIVPPGARKVVLGLLVDGDRPRLSRKFRDSLRMHLYYCLRVDVGPVAHANRRGFTSVYGLRNHLAGLVAFASQVDPVFGADVRAKMAQVNWPI